MRRPDNHTCFFFFLRCRFFRVFFVPFPLSLCMESKSYVLSFRMVFFYLVTTGWIFYISVCDSSINQSINHYKSLLFRVLRHLDTVLSFGRRGLINIRLGYWVVDSDLVKGLQQQAPPVCRLLINNKELESVLLYLHSMSTLCA